MLGNIGVPLIHHQRHPARWNEEQWVRHARYMCTALKKWSARDTFSSLSSSLDGIQHLRKPGVQHLSRMATSCFEWLRTRKLPRDIAFLPDGMESIEALLRDAYRSFSSNGDLAVEKAEPLAVETAQPATARAELAAARAELAIVKSAKAELAAAKAELAAFKASRSWRITEPLRQFVSLLR
jgi:hypothetical protein